MKERIEAISDLNEAYYDGFKVITTEQSIEVGINNGRGCCETWGHFWTNDNPSEFVGAELLGVFIVDESLDVHKLDKEVDGGLDAGAVMFVNFKTDRGVLQFTAYNSHNGYYGHDAYVESTQLSHLEVL